VALLLGLAAAPLSRAGSDGGAVAPPAPERPLDYARPLVPSDLAGRSLDELRLMRNTIYARAGRRFSDPALRDYFARQPWYQPRAGGAAKLGAVDRANLRAIADEEKRLQLQPVTERCPEAGPNGKLVDARFERELSEQAAKLNPQGEYGPPKDCHRQVSLFCGPDLDGDGTSESIVKIKWRTLLNERTCRTIRDSNDYWDTAVTFLVSGRAGKWKAIAPLGIDIEGDQQDMHTSAWFVRQRDGALAVRSTTTNVSSDTMCEFGDYVVWGLRHGQLRKLESGEVPRQCPK
jgi:hypothetical protein